MPELEASIRDLISRYLSGDITADELSDQLPDGWQLDEANDPAASDLALLAIGYLAGYQSGNRDEDELRTALGEMLSGTVLIEYPAIDLLSVLTKQIAETIEESAGGDSSLSEGFELRRSQHPRTEHRTTTALPGRPRSR